MAGILGPGRVLVGKQHETSFIDGGNGFAVLAIGISRGNADLIPGAFGRAMGDLNESLAPGFVFAGPFGWLAMGVAGLGAAFPNFMGRLLC